MDNIAIAKTMNAQTVDKLLGRLSWKISNGMDAIKIKTTLSHEKTAWTNTDDDGKGLEIKCRTA